MGLGLGIGLGLGLGIGLGWKWARIRLDRMSIIVWISLNLKHLLLSRSPFVFSFSPPGIESSNVTSTHAPSSVWNSIGRR